jgi:hypothetical protein
VLFGAFIQALSVTSNCAPSQFAYPPMTKEATKEAATKVRLPATHRIEETAQPMRRGRAEGKVGHTSFAGQDCRSLDDCQGQGTLIPARPQCDDPTVVCQTVCLRCLVATGGTLQRCGKSFEYRRSQFRCQMSRGCRVLVQARAKKDATEKEKPGAATDAKMDDAPAAPEVSSPAHSFSARTVQRHAALCFCASHCHRWHTARWCAPRAAPPCAAAHMMELCAVAAMLRAG